MSAELRPCQTRVVAEIERAIEAGQRRIILVAPTGSGNAIIGASIICDAVEKGRSVAVLAHRPEIIQQTSEKLFAESVDHGPIQAGYATRPGSSVPVTSAQTLWSRAMTRRSMELPPADILIIDESHHTPAQSYAKIVAAFPNAVLIGLTATACRSDGRGPGDFFDQIIECPQVAELIEQGFLVKTRVFAPAAPDLKGVEVRGGDYIEDQLAERMDRANLVSPLVTHWHKFGGRRRTICFAVNVHHSVHIRDEFIKAGVRAEHIDGTTPTADRDAALRRLASSETEVLCNCMVLTEGWDMPEVACCISARPTLKMGLYRQMLGRVLRPAANEPNAIVIDHSGATYRHGSVEDSVERILDSTKRSESRTHQRRLERGHCSRMIECTNCGTIRAAGEKCQHCGFLPAPKRKSVAFAEGELVAVDRKSRAGLLFSDPNERMIWHRMLVGYTLEKGQKLARAAHLFRERFGDWPPYGGVKPLTPTPEVRSWIRSRDIAYFRRPEKQKERDEARR